ncbi:MAG: NAD(P)/FAD-dependent oxidoreductase [Bacillota bacterium]|nr:NAD(P)/FAD-dependent oxidoreductase [Bacillota bacterium]
MKPCESSDGFNTVIIGGGPAGLMAAYAASEAGNKVTLLEKNNFPGRKLRITGKGRCNITNNCTNDIFFQNVPVNPKFLLSALSRFSPADTISFFESIGLPLKTERGNRVFPVSDKASDVVSALVKAARNKGVDIKNAEAFDIIARDNAVCAVRTEAGLIPCDFCVIATGGLSYPQTGSTGDGYVFAKALGHSVTPLKASLVPLVASPELCSRLQGLSLRNVKISVKDENKEVYSDFGEMLFTHYGISGPLILSASSHLRDFKEKKYTVTIDLKPALDSDTLDKRILRDFSEETNRDIINGLDRLLPQKLIPVIIDLAGIPPRRKINSVTKEERAALLKVVKAMEIPVEGPRPIDEAVITSGGVSVKEINPKTMESKLVKNLYFSGEVIDTDAYTGGFNLQIAWSTGFLAGSSIKERCFRWS